MIVWDLIFAFGIALILSVIFAGLFGRRGPWASVFILFVIIFLAAWVGGIWIRPVGPTLAGVYWLPFLLLGLLFALLLAAAAASSRPPRRSSTPAREAAEAAERVRVFDVFLVVLIVGLAAAVIFGYIFRA
jgi:hypothetical protein